MGGGGGGQVAHAPLEGVAGVLAREGAGCRVGGGREQVRLLPLALIQPCPVASTPFCPL